MFGADNMPSRPVAIAEAPVPVRLHRRCSPRLSAIWHRYCRAQECSKQRRALRELDDHLLADIGISRELAQREAEKPFWMLMLSGRC